MNSSASATPDASKPASNTTMISLMPNQLMEMLATAETKGCVAGRAQALKEMQNSASTSPQPSSKITGKRKKDKTEYIMKDGRKVKPKLTSYMHFDKLNRDAMKEAHPTATLTDISSKLGAKWRSYTDEQKEKYVQLAKEDKERYVAECALAKPVHMQGAASTSLDMQPMPPSLAVQPLSVQPLSVQPIHVPLIPAPFVFPTETPPQ